MFSLGCVSLRRLRGSHGARVVLRFRWAVSRGHLKIVRVGGFFCFWWETSSGAKVWGVSVPGKEKIRNPARWEGWVLDFFSFIGVLMIVDENVVRVGFFGGE